MTSESSHAQSQESLRVDEVDPRNDHLVGVSSYSMCISYYGRLLERLIHEFSRWQDENQENDGREEAEAHEFDVDLNWSSNRGEDGIENNDLYNN